MNMPHRYGWPFLSFAAVVFLWFMAESGVQPTHGNRVEDTAGGVLAPDAGPITWVEIESGGGIVRFERRSNGWFDATRRSELSEATAGSLLQAIKFMRVAAPVRILRPEAIAGMPGEHLGVKQLTLRVRLGSRRGLELEAGFGDRANDGILQYMGITGDDAIYLMSGFVGEAWTQVSRQ